MGGRLPDGTVRERVTCPSDIITPREAVISLGPLAVVALLIWGWLRWQTREVGG